MRTTTPALWALLALAACGDGEDSPLDKAITAAGGEDALAALTSYRLEVTGTRYFAGEEAAPGAALPVANQYTGTLTVDLAGDASRFDISRTIKAFDATVPPQSFSELVRGNLGHVTGDDGCSAARPATSRPPAPRRSAASSGCSRRRSCCATSPPTARSPATPAPRRSTGGRTT